MNGQSSGIFYGWWVATTCMFTMSLTVGAFYYALPFLYPAIVESEGISRSQVTTGFFYGFTFVAPFFGIMAGTIIDKLGARQVIRIGLWFIGIPLLLMGFVAKDLQATPWQYYILCITIVIGYVLAGPIPNQVLISNWFREKRGRAMGYVYTGLGVGGIISILVTPWLIEQYGWRGTFQVLGVAILIPLVPLVQWVTRSSPQEMNLTPDGAAPETVGEGNPSSSGMNLREASKTRNFWMILGGTWFTLFAIGTVIDHLVFHLTDQGFTKGFAQNVMFWVLVASLAGRTLVGFLADRYSKKNVMAVCYLMLALAIPLLIKVPDLTAVWAFTIIFGFFMGADYMLIPLVTAECFGLASLGKLLAAIIMGYSVGQFFGPRVAGQIYDSLHSYDYAWMMITAAGIIGATLIYFVSPPKKAEAGNESKQD